MTEKAVKWIHNVHVISAILFLLSYTIKTVIMMLNHPNFEQWRRRTMMTEILITVVLTATGVLQLYHIGWAVLGGWFHLKVALVGAGIVLGIIAFRRKMKWLVLVTNLIFIYALLLALAKNPELHQLNMPALWP